MVARAAALSTRFALHGLEASRARFFLSSGSQISRFRRGYLEAR